jgi:hypothetical protein
MIKIRSERNVRHCVSMRSLLLPFVPLRRDDGDLGAPELVSKLGKKRGIMRSVPLVSVNVCYWFDVVRLTATWWTSKLGSDMSCLRHRSPATAAFGSPQTGPSCPFEEHSSSLSKD